MEDIINVNDLADMQRMITDKTRNKIETGLSEIRGTMDMLEDINSIITALIKECDDRQNHIEILENDKRSLEQQLLNKDNIIDEFDSDRKRYQQLEDGNVNITYILNTLQKDRECLEKEKNRLVDDKDKFKKVKAEFEEKKQELIEEKDNATERARKLKEECNTKSKSIDKLTVDKNNLNSDKKKLEDNIKKLNETIGEKEREYLEQLSQLNDDYEKELSKKNGVIEEKNKEILNYYEEVDWFRKYAIDQDEKIFEYFSQHTGRESKLKSHYETYLNNKYKEVERREKFGDKGVFTTRSDGKTNKEEKKVRLDKSSKEKQAEKKKDIDMCNKKEDNMSRYSHNGNDYDGPVI